MRRIRYQQVHFSILSLIVSGDINPRIRSSQGKAKGGFADRGSPETDARVLDDTLRCTAKDDACVRLISP